MPGISEKADAIAIPMRNETRGRIMTDVGKSLRVAWFYNDRVTAVA